MRSRLLGPRGYLGMPWVIGATLVLALLLFGMPPSHALALSTALAQEPRPEPSSAPADVTARGGEAVIDPGKEDLLAEMLGRGETLAGECTFTGGQAERTFVRSTYKCSAGEVVIELRHPSKATAPAATTSSFAITVQSGTPPAALINDLAGRIRARESAFAWRFLAPPVKETSSSFVLGAVLALLAVAALGWAWWRRRSAA